MTLVLALIVFALLFGGVGLAVEGLRILLILAIILIIAAVITGRPVP